jgi:hypothetical protein
MAAADGLKVRKSPDPRHSRIKMLLDQYWAEENPAIPSLPWGAADAGALGQFLRANPKLAVEAVERCLRNRLRSEDHAPAERVHRWIGDLLRYSSGPLNRFKQPARGSALAAEASVGTYRPGMSYKTDDEPCKPLRDVMSAAWQDRVIRLHHSRSQELTDLELQFLKEENLL